MGASLRAPLRALRLLALTALVAALLCATAYAAGQALQRHEATGPTTTVTDPPAAMAAPIGSDELPTREGAFAMIFSGGQAVHYSPDFAANGDNGASHGCVNVRDYDGIAALFDQVQVGDRVIVYWS